MKKQILLFTMASALALFISCNPAQYAWHWGMRNKTEQILIVKFPYSESYQTHTLLPGQTLSLSHIDTGKRHNKHFDDYFKQAVSENGEDVYWQILSEDDVVLKTWRYSDIGLPDQRFFDESSWVYRQVAGGGGEVVAHYLWTFAIQPEDITQY